MAIEKTIYPSVRLEVIGISGKKDTGKKIFAEILQNEMEEICSKPIVIAGYADQIYQTLISLFSPKLKWEHAQNKNEPIAGLKVDNEEATMTKLLQNFGIYAKNIDPSVWIDRVFKHRIPDYFYIIHDVRLVDEANAVINNKGTLIRLQTDIYDKEDKHITETALDDFDFPIVVSVNGDRVAMKNDIREIVRNLNV
jgi:hypothetical protein